MFRMSKQNENVISSFSFVNSFTGPQNADELMYDVEQIPIKNRVRIDLKKYVDEKPDHYLQAYKQPIMPMVDEMTFYATLCL